MSKHTPEPWGLGAIESGQEAIDGANGEEVTGWLSPDNRRRIVACVNACAGIPTEALETGLIKRALDLLEQFGSGDFWNGKEVEYARDQARAALAKVRP